VKILLAPDSFKGALSAAEVAAAMERGLRRVWANAECVLLPVADGGEGTLDTLLLAGGGRRFTTSVRGPLGEPILADWGLLRDGETAIIELAQAAGLTQVPKERRDPKTATTYGVGELLRAAMRTPGVRRLLIGLGGSATNDGGAGILQALGIALVDSAGAPLAPGGAALAGLASAGRAPATGVEVRIACDVDNPLTGPRGAAAVFGPQKGASRDDVRVLDAALAHFAAVLGIDATRPGLGAAGGTPAGLLYAFANASLVPGIDLVLDALDFERHLAGADLVLTGEGQTLGGKAIAGVARRARAQGVPVGAIVGAVDPALDTARLAAETEVAAVLPVAPGPCSLEESIAHTAEWIESATERAVRWVAIGR
jgi:glycerate kinase